MKRILAVLLCVVVLVSLLAVTAIATDFDLWGRLSGTEMEAADGASMVSDTADGEKFDALIEEMSGNSEQIEVLPKN